MSANPRKKPSRRDFLKTSAAASAAGAVAASFPSISLGRAAKNRKLKLGFIGCGGRGTGAASQALSADQHVELTAMGDVFPDQIEKALAVLEKKHSGQLDVPKKRQFIGLDAYQEVLDSGVDVVILTSPPGFRPMMFEAAVEKGVHIFCEKPMGTDVPGVKRVAAAARKAKEKGLTVMSGFCWRYSESRRGAYQQIFDGAIGDVRSVYATYLNPTVHAMPDDPVKPEQLRDIEWQIQNWHNFVWIGGDSLVEQAIHSVDKIGWVLGDTDPVSCVGMGGRQQPMPGTQIFDHFAITYEYPNGIRAFMHSRQQSNVYNENSDYITGCDGVCTIGKGTDPFITDNAGQPSWRFKSDPDSGMSPNMYQQEHDELFASIRNDTAHNDGEWMTHSCLLGIMGRMAAYTGQKITWDQVINDETSLYPEGLEWDSRIDVGPMPTPGSTELVPATIKA